MIAQDIKRLETELIDWEAKVPNLIKDIDIRIQTAESIARKRPYMNPNSKIPFRSGRTPH